MGVQRMQFQNETEPVQGNISQIFKTSWGLNEVWVRPVILTLTGEWNG